MTETTIHQDQLAAQARIGKTRQDRWVGRAPVQIDGLLSYTEPGSTSPLAHEGTITTRPMDTGMRDMAGGTRRRNVGSTAMTIHQGRAVAVAPIGKTRQACAADQELHQIDMVAVASVWPDADD